MVEQVRQNLFLCAITYCVQGELLLALRECLATFYFSPNEIWFLLIHLAHIPEVIILQCINCTTECSLNPINFPNFGKN